VSRRSLNIAVERWPIAGSFTIARGSRTEAVVVVAAVAEAGQAGRGECVPYARYGESVDGVVAQIAGVRSLIEAGVDRLALSAALPRGAARNALDCALWDLEAKQAGVPAHVLAGIDRLAPATTAYTISLGDPAAMAAAAAAASEAGRPILKIKLGGADGRDLERIGAIRDAASDATLIADANEGWAQEALASHLEACAAAGFALVEQPLPAGRDEALRGVSRAVPVCADESVHGLDGLERLAGLYDAVNVKLDKTGGLTEALAVQKEAERLGFAVMVGCMVGTSLAMAPAMLLTPRARFVDLDGPLLLAADRQPGLRYEGATVFPPSSALWG
jgi:L-alanine-DL-glutamate epimerase-like enolase superfamily enzyme